MLAATQILPSGNPNLFEARPNAAATYRRFMADMGSPDVQHEARALIDNAIDQLDLLACDLPDHPHQLGSWMADRFEQTTAKYAKYLEDRKQGAPRSYFSNRAHALYFLRAVAPTKLVDGAWLAGILKFRQNPKFAASFGAHLVSLWTNGVAATLAAYVADAD